MPVIVWFQPSFDCIDRFIESPQYETSPFLDLLTCEWADVHSRASRYIFAVFHYECDQKLLWLNMFETVVWWPLLV